MRRNLQRFLWWGGGMLAILIYSSTLVGQAAPESKISVPVINDWSSRHLIYSQPASEDDARQVKRDPRYWQQLYRKELPSISPAEDGFRDDTSSELPSLWHFGGDQKLKGDWQEDMGSGASVTAGNYPAKYSLSVGVAKCASTGKPDFVIYNTGLQGTATQASIVAYDNLYSSCTGTVPSVYWAYNTTGQVLTSPVYSLDGTQVAFVQTNACVAGDFGLAEMGGFDDRDRGRPRSPYIRKLHASYRACTTLPCVTSVVLPIHWARPTTTPRRPSLSTTTTTRPGLATTMVGLHKFTGIFKGSPREVRTGGFPVRVNPTNPLALSDPIHDYVTGNIFVGDAGGYLYSVNSSTGAVIKSGQLDFGAGLANSPLLDSTGRFLYVFASSDGTTNCTGGPRLALRFTSSAPASQPARWERRSWWATASPMARCPIPAPCMAAILTAPTLTPVLPAALAIFTFAVTPAELQRCIRFRLRRVFPAQQSRYAALSTSTTPCSPITDILNPNTGGGATEWMFLGVGAGGISSGCASGGCIFNFKDTPWKASNAYVLGDEILDSHLQIQVASKAGTSGGTTPAFGSMTAGVLTTDGTVHWLDQGPLTTTTPAAWVKTHAYIKGNIILDPNNNIQLVTTAGTSGATIPTFRKNAGAVTTDGPVRWTNVGALATAAMPAAGGTSGVIIDNYVQSVAGASQVYFSTLSNQTCTTSGGTGGCAVQASQSALK